MLLALFGYALGTLQVLVVDWLRRRREHARQLRALRAEFRILRVHNRKYEYDTENWHKEDSVPRPPVASPQFVPTISSVDFELTDEYSNDNSQEAFLGITSGLSLLQYYDEKWHEVTESAQDPNNANEKQRFIDTGVALMREYDKVLDRTQFLAADALRDIDRRILELRLWRQVGRSFHPLRPGPLPPPFAPDDPRIIAFVANGGELLPSTSPDGEESAVNAKQNVVLWLIVLILATTSVAEGLESSSRCFLVVIPTAMVGGLLLFQLRPKQGKE